jgi:hypothetical protein
MKTKYLIYTSLFIFLFALLWNGLIHFIILRSADSEIAYLHRPDLSDKMWLSLIVTLCLSILFTVSYSKWRKDGNLKETLLHSIFFAILMGIIVDLNQYVLYPLPFCLIIQWFLFGVVEFIIYGLIAKAVFSKIK